MRLETRKKDAFSVIGKEGSTSDGPDFIQKLWADANAHFSEVRALAKRDEARPARWLLGSHVRLFPLFRALGGQFQQGAVPGRCECEDGAQAPQGWTKWTIPGYEYLCVQAEGESTFSQVLEFMKSQGIPLAGAVQDFTCPTTGTNYMLFPIRLL